MAMCLVRHAAREIPFPGDDSDGRGERGDEEKENTQWVLIPFRKIANVCFQGFGMSFRWLALTK